MKALSLWQPWASLWVLGPKIHETRHWSTDHRGQLAVHAAKKLVVDVDDRLNAICEEVFGCSWNHTLPRGAVVGVVEIADVVSTTTMSDLDPHSDDYACGDFSPGRFAWRRGNTFSLDKAIPWVGRQAMFSVPDNVFDGVRATVTAV